MTIIQEAQLPAPSPYVELFDLDTTNIGGGNIFHFTQYLNSASLIIWQTNAYAPVPIQVQGFEWNATTASPPTPTMTISNVQKVILPYIISLGDLVGAKVTRWRTFAKFLDQGTNPDPTQFWKDTYLIQQKTTHDKNNIQYALCSPMDRPGLMLPLRQILKDQGFPGVARSQ